MNNDFVVLLMGAATLIISSIVMHQTNGIFNIKKLSLPGVWFFAYLLLIFIPSFFVFFSKDDPYRFNYIYTMASALFTVPLGVLLANCILKFQPKEIGFFHARPVEDNPKSMLRITNFSLFLFVALVLIVLWYSEQTTPVPLIYMFTNPDNSDQLTMLREYSFKLLDSPIRYLYHLTRDFLLPFLMLLAAGNYYLSRSKLWLFLLIFTSIFGLAFAGANIAKGPIFSIIILLFLNIAILKGGKIGWKLFIFGGLLCISFPLLVITFSQEVLSWDGFLIAIQKVYERIFVAPASIVYYFFEIVPERFPFQMGRCMGVVGKLLGLGPTDLAGYTAWYITGMDYATTSVSGAFVTQLFGDFGFPGVISGGLLVGVAMQCIHVTLMRGRKTIISITTYVLFIFFFATLTYLQIVGALILSGAPLLWILYKTKILG